jgi:hypothetical protein
MTFIYLTLETSNATQVIRFAIETQEFGDDRC